MKHTICNLLIGAVLAVTLLAIYAGAYSSGQAYLIGKCDTYGHIEHEGTIYMCVNTKKAQDLGMNR